MCLINNMKIENIILIVIGIILSILVIRYYFTTYENFQNSDIEYGIIHMTTANMSSIKNPSTTDNNSHNLWNNQLLQLREPTTDTLLLMSTPPSDLQGTGSNKTISLRNDLESDNSKLNGLLPDKRMIGSFIFTDSFNLNDISRDKSIKLIRHNQNDIVSSFGKVSNTNNNFSSNNFEQVGRIGVLNVINTSPVYGMNVGFNTPTASNLIDLVKARGNLEKLNSIVSENVIRDVNLSRQIETYLKNKIFKNSDSISDTLSNSDLVNLIKSSNISNINMFSNELTGNFYDTCDTNTNDDNNNLICFGQNIYEKLIRYITNNGMYNNITINFKGMEEVLQSLSTNFSNLTFFNSDDSDNNKFTNIYGGINTKINTDDYPVTITGSDIDISSIREPSLTITIPLGFKVKLQKYENDSINGTIEFSFPFTNFTQINELYKTDTNDSESLFNAYSDTYTSFIDEIKNNLGGNYSTGGGLTGKLKYLNGMYYMEIKNINQGSTPTFRKASINMLDDTLETISEIDLNISNVLPNKIITNSATNKSNSAYAFYGVKVNIVNFYVYRNKMINNYLKLRRGFMNPSEVFNAAITNASYNSKDNQFKLFTKFINDANVPRINFYKLKKNKVKTNHVVLGDIAILQSNVDNNQAFFNIYTTIPKHCYKEIRDWEPSDKVYEQTNPYLALYKNEYLNTFIAMKENKLPDGKVGIISPCPDHAYRIDNLINQNNEAIVRCRKYNKMKQKNPIFNTINDDLINENLEKKVYDQEKKITMLKEYANKLQQENSKSRIINQEYNRSRLSDFLDKQKSSLDNAVDKLIDGNNRVDININYRIKVLDDLIKHIIEVATSVIPFETKKKLVKKISELKNTSLMGPLADKKIDEILSECPTFNMDGYYRRDPPCLGCTIPKDQT